MPDYAYKTPDGSGIFRVVIGGELEDQTKTIEEANLWPVEATIPEGKVQDWSNGNGWYVDNGTVKPCLKDAPLPAVPAFIEQYKLRLWLIEKGLLPLVEGMIANEANWPSAQAHAEAVTRWNCVQNVQRDSVMVNTLGAALGLDQAQIDAAFIEAEKLT